MASMIEFNQGSAMIYYFQLFASGKLKDDNYKKAELSEAYIVMLFNYMSRLQR
jgi:hypothetical protein